MRRILAIAAAFALASCDTYQSSQTLVNGLGKTIASLKPAGSPDAISVMTAKSVPEYYKDLEHCRAIVATSMGPSGVEDNLEALKRALKAHPHDKILSLSYIDDDRAIRRREAIKSCLSRAGYIVQK